MHQIELLKQSCKQYKEQYCEPIDYKAIDMFVVSALTRFSAINKLANSGMVTLEMLSNSQNSLLEAESIVKKLIIHHPGQADILYNYGNILQNLGEIIMQNPQKGDQYNQTYRALGYIKHSRDIFASLHSKIEKQDIRAQKIVPSYKLRSQESTKFLAVFLGEIQKAAINKYRATKLICDHSGEKLTNARALEDQDKSRMQKSKKRSQELKKTRNQIQMQKQQELQDERKKMEQLEQQNQKELQKIQKQWQKDIQEKKDKERRQGEKKKRGGGRGKKSYEDDGFIEDGYSQDDFGDQEFNESNFNKNNKMKRKQKHPDDNLSDSPSQIDKLFDDEQNQKRESDDQGLEEEFEFNPQREKERREERARRKKELKKQKRAESKKRLKREKKTKYKSSVTKNKNSTGLMETAMDIPDEDIDVDQILDQLDQEGQIEKRDDQLSKSQTMKGNIIQDDQEDDI